MTSKRHSNRWSTSRGFTLVESIIVLVVLGIAAATVATLSGGIFSGQADNKTLQVGMKLLGECAEQVLATRRATGPGLGYAATPSCSNLVGFPGFNAPTVKLVVETTTGNFPVNTAGCITGDCGCPTGGSCKLVTIAVTTNPGGDELSTVTLLLVGP